jgi:beta-lactamase regulating signal transducer with metallopeptidase domain
MTDQLLHLIAQQSWQIAVLAMVVAVMHRTFARNRPHLAHVLWMLVLIKSVTPPIWSHSFGIFSHLQAVWSVNQNVPENPRDVRLTAIHHESVDSLQSSSVATNSPASSTTDLGDLTATRELPVPENESVVIAATSQEYARYERSFSWPVILLSLIGIGAATVMISMAVRCCLCLWQLQKHRTVEFDDVLREQLADLAQKLHVRRVPKIMVSDVLFGPAVFGFWRHVIVLPKCLIESGRTSRQDRCQSDEDVASGCEVPLSRKDLQFLEPILAHELLHIRRGDLRTGLVQAISQSLWWFHPAVWMCSRWLAREAERCCDEQVIAELGCSPAQYARCLLSVIESKHSLQPIPIFPGMKPVEITSQRMERIMSLKRDLKKQTPLWCWVTVILLAVVVLPGARPTSVNDENTSVRAPVTEENSERSIVTLLQAQKAGVPADGAGTSSVANSDKHAGSSLPTGLPPMDIRLSKDFIYSHKLPFKNETTICLVNEKPVTVGAVLTGTAADILLKYMPEMDEKDRGEVIAAEIRTSLPRFVYQEVILQHFESELTSEQEVKLKNAEAERSEAIVKVLSESRVQSSPVIDQHKFVADSLRNYRTDAAGTLTAFSREGRVAKLIADSPSPAFQIAERVTVDMSREILLEAALRSPVSFHFQDVSLPEAIRMIAIDHRINITFKASALESVPGGVPSGPLEDAKVSFSCDGEPLGNALRRLVSSLGLRMTVYRDTVMFEENQVETLLKPEPAKDHGSWTYRLTDRYVAVRYDVHQVADIVAPNSAGSQAADAAPLIELIKTTIAPTTWEQTGRITYLPAVNSILVVHSAEVHEEIRDLLTQLRKDQDLVSIKAQLLRMESAEQLKGIEKQCSLHSLNDQKRWALLTKERSDAISKLLAEQECQVISRPQLTTLSGSPGAVEVGNIDGEVFNGFRLVVEPRAIADSRVIRLKHAVEIGRKMTLDEFAGADGFASLAKDELLIASGQTLLLVIEPEVAPTAQNADQATDRFVVLLTVERLQEAEATASDRQPASRLLNSEK